MDTLLRVLPSAADCRATARIVGRRSVTPLRDGSGELLLPSNFKDLEETEQDAIKARGGTPFVTYSVEVAQVTPFRKSWSIERRYREFVVLSNTLERHSSTKERYLPVKLPPKQIFMVDAAFLKKRQTGLDAWIQQIPKILQSSTDAVAVDSIHDAIRSFLLPAAVRLLRHKRIQSDGASISSVTSDPTPPPSPATSPPTRPHGGSGGDVVPPLPGMSESEFSTREIKMEEHERTTATSLGAGAERTAAEELGDYNGDSNNPHVVHPQQALALVSCGSYVSEWSEDDNRRKVTNKLCMPLESMNNVISIVYRDGCYTYFRASLLLRRIVDDNDKQRNTNIQIDTAEKIEKDIEDKIKKWLRIPDDEKYSDSGTAVFPVRFQHSKVGSVKVYAKLKILMT